MWLSRLLGLKPEDCEAEVRRDQRRSEMKAADDLIALANRIEETVEQIARGKR